MARDDPAIERHLVKRYSVGRFYDTMTLAYVDAAQSRDLVGEGADMIVRDAKSGEDITAAALRLTH